MAKKHNSSGRSKATSQFVMLEHYLLDSGAWCSLTTQARCAFIEIARHYKPGQNGRLAMSGRKLAEALSISRQKATRALVELVECGFIEQVKVGGFNVKSGMGRATEWRLNTYKCDVTGQLPSRAFMRWQAGKIHFTASSQSHLGLTTGPRPINAQQYCRKVALT